MRLSPFERVGTYAAAILTGAVLLLAGCGTSARTIDRTLPDAFPDHGLNEILAHLENPSDTLHAFRARASLVIDSPERSGQFSAEIRSRRGDSLYVAISPGFGIEAARALITPDSFFFYDRLKNRLLAGSLESASDLLPEPFTSDALFENLLGLLAPATTGNLELTHDDSFYYLKERDGSTTYVIDPAFWRVTRYEERDASGTLLELRYFSEFSEFDGVILPRRLEFDRPQDERSAVIYYRGLDLNLRPGDLDFDLRVRDSTERVYSGD